MLDHLTITEDWDGSGLPPIGERVGTRILNIKGIYEPAIIVAHVPQYGELVAVFVIEDGSDWSWSGYYSFLPWRQVSSLNA